MDNHVYLDDCLSQEVIWLSRQLLSQPCLQVIILVPHPHLDPVTRVVALTETSFIASCDKNQELTRRIFRSILDWAPVGLSLSSSWSSPPGRWRRGRWSRSCPWLSGPEHTPLRNIKLSIIQREHSLKVSPYALASKNQMKTTYFVVVVGVGGWWY